MIRRHRKLVPSVVHSDMGALPPAFVTLLSILVTPKDFNMHLPLLRLKANVVINRQNL